MEEKNSFKYFNYFVFTHFLGRSLYAVFVPILLIKNGYAIDQAVLFLALVWSTALLGVIVGTRILRFRQFLYFSLLASFSEIALIFLFLIKSVSPSLFILLFLFEGLYYAFYYLGYNGVFIKKNSGANTVKNLANSQISVRIGSLVAPFIGAGLLLFGRSFLLFSAGILVLLSMFPLAKALGSDSDINSNGDVNISPYVAGVLVYYGLSGSLDMNLFGMWSIFSFTQGYSLFFISFIPASSAIVAILLLDRMKKKMRTPRAAFLFILTGAILVISVSIWRIIYPEFLAISNLIASLGSFLMGFPVLTQLYGLFSQKRSYRSLFLMQGVPIIFFAITGYLIWWFSISLSLYLPLIITPILLLMAPFLVKNFKNNS